MPGLVLFFFYYYFLFSEVQKQTKAMSKTFSIQTSLYGAVIQTASEALSTAAAFHLLTLQVVGVNPE